MAGEEETHPSNAVFEYTPPEFFGKQSQIPKWLQAWVADIFIFVSVHYNFWLLPFLGAFYAMYQCGYGLVVVAVVVVYLPSFLDASEKTAKGRPWDSFRQSRWMLLCANFLG